MSSPVRELVWVRRRFAGRPDQVAAVRGLVSGVIGEESPAHDVARLLVSEAATNALLHTASGELGGSLEVHCELLNQRRLRVEVRDEGSAKQPRRRAHEAEALTGRGLELLDALAARWAPAAVPRVILLTNN